VAGVLDSNFRRAFCLLLKAAGHTKNRRAQNNKRRREKLKDFPVTFLTYPTRRIILGELTDKRKLELNIGFKLRESTRSTEITLSNTKILRESSWYFGIVFLLFLTS